MPQPRRRRNYRLDRREKDAICFELFLLCLIVYLTINNWTTACSWFFNLYCLLQCLLLVTIRRYMSRTMDNIESTPRSQVITIGLFMPVQIVMTVLGGVQFFNAPMMTCRKEHSGEVIYIIVFMFAVSLCFVFALLLVCVLMPVWCQKLKSRIRRRRLEGRIQNMDGIIDPEPLVPNPLAVAAG